MAETLLYVVATSQKEAEDIAFQCGHWLKSEADKHLKEVQAPPTDPYYAAQYRVYKVRKKLE